MPVRRSVLVTRTPFSGLGGAICFSVSFERDFVATEPLIVVTFPPISAVSLREGLSTTGDVRAIHFMPSWPLATPLFISHGARVINFDGLGGDERHCRGHGDPCQQDAIA